MRINLEKIKVILGCIGLSLFLHSTAIAESLPGTVLWKLDIGSAIWTPVKHNEGILYFGADNGVLYALNSESKRLIWEFKTDGLIRSGIEIVKGEIWFASDDGFLYSINSKTGKLIWKFDLENLNLSRRLPAVEAPYEYDYLHSSPVYNNGLIYIGGLNGKLYALDSKTGKQRWFFQSQAKIRSTPVIHGRHVYFGSWDGKFYCLDSSTGQKVWQFDSEGIIQDSPAIGGGQVFFGSRSTKFVALDEKTGKLNWQYIHKNGSWAESSPVYRDGIVYVGSSDALKLFAFNAKTGVVKWVFKTGGWSWGKPLLSNNKIYIGAISASPYYFENVKLKSGIFSVDQQSGQLLWEQNSKPVKGYVTGGFHAEGVVVSGVLYVGGIDGTLYAYKA